MRALLTLIPALLLATSVPSSHAAADGDVERTRTLIEALGGASVEQFINLVYQQSVSALVHANPQQGDEVQRFVEQQVLPEIRAAVPAMMATLAQGYAQVFTPDEIEQIAAFYQSPAGQKLRRARPALMRETVQFGQLWAAQTFRAALTKLKPQIEAEGLTAPDI